MESDTGKSGYEKKPHHALHRANACPIARDGMPGQDREGYAEHDQRDQLPHTCRVLQQQELGARSEQANEKYPQDKRAHDYCSCAATVPAGHILAASIVNFERSIAVSFEFA